MWTKICGFRDVADLRLMTPLHSDAIGLNFYAQSVRYVAPEMAAAIVREMSPGMTAVAVFVNASVAEMLAITQHVGIDVIQLHGDESIETAGRLSDAGRRVIRAIRIDSQTGFAPVASAVTAYERAGIPLWACLVDAAVSGSFGGTGKTVPGTLVRDWPANYPPLILAGGLTPETVASAIQDVRPFGVDVASGVELSPGKKDPRQMQQFLAAAIKL